MHQLGVVYLICAKCSALSENHRQTLAGSHILGLEIVHSYCPGIHNADGREIGVSV